MLGFFLFLSPRSLKSQRAFISFTRLCRRDPAGDGFAGFLSLGAVFLHRFPLIPFPLFFFFGISAATCFSGVCFFPQGRPPRARNSPATAIATPSPSPIPSLPLKRQGLFTLRVFGFQAWDQRDYSSFCLSGRFFSPMEKRSLFSHLDDFSFFPFAGVYYGEEFDPRSSLLVFRMKSSCKPLPNASFPDGSLFPSVLPCQEGPLPSRIFARERNLFLIYLQCRFPELGLICSPLSPPPSSLSEGSPPPPLLGRLRSQAIPPLLSDETTDELKTHHSQTLTVGPPPVSQAFFLFWA